MLQQAPFNPSPLHLSKQTSPVSPFNLQAPKTIQTSFSVNFNNSNHDQRSEIGPMAPKSTLPSILETLMPILGANNVQERGFKFEFKLY